jgi:tetratricopeptide (TPR) repeat protein
MIHAVIIALAAASSAAAGAPAAAPQAPASPHTLQQDFDAATQAAANGNCTAAVKLFETLEQGGAVKPGTLPAAAIAVRKGQCLVAIGRRDEGKASILKGLPAIVAAGENFVSDVYEAQKALGDAALNEYDFSTARTRYEAALTHVSGLNRLPALMGLTKAAMFDGTSASLDYSAEGLRIIDAQSEPDKTLRSFFLTIHARALLNRGQTSQAYDELKQALKLQGGLTEKITLAEGSMRSDLALAALLDGQRDDAHRYLAYSGAGRIAQSPFAMGQNMDVPVCGSETGLQPGDVAVVEFSIGSDGSVGSAQTIYTRGGPEVAAAFARAVRQWYWDPERLAKIPPFYLLASRVELRCTRAGADAPGITAPLVERFYGWAANHVTVPTNSGLDAATAKQLRQMLAAPDAKSDPARYVAMAGVLSQADDRPGTETSAMLAEALSTAQRANLPADVIDALQVFRALADSPWQRDKVSPKRDLPIFAQSIFQLAASPDLARDPIAADTLRLSGAKLAHWFDDPSPIRAQLELVASDARLDEHHPLRQAANLRLADLAAAAGQLDQAQAAFERTGLTAEQCSLLGVKPTLAKSHASSSDYPTQALMYGFEGWTKVEYDVKANGTTTGGRTLMAYPPFVFSDGAAAMTKDFVFDKSYRPGDSVACTADRQGINFHIPH